jgi:hypothetical protein
MRDLSFYVNIKLKYILYIMVGVFELGSTGLGYDPVTVYCEYAQNI